MKVLSRLLCLVLCLPLQGQAAPQVHILVVKCIVKSMDPGIVVQDLQVEVTNTTRNKSRQYLSEIDERGTFFQVTLIDFARFVAEEGDTFRVVAKLASGEVVAQISYVLTGSDILTSVAEINITVYPAPEIKSVILVSGDTTGETIVKITGLNFRVGATLRVGDNPVLAVIVNHSSMSEITALLPAGQVGVANLTITNLDGRSHTLELMKY